MIPRCPCKGEAPFRAIDPSPARGNVAGGLPGVRESPVVLIVDAIPQFPLKGEIPLKDSDPSAEPIRQDVAGTSCRAAELGPATLRLRATAPVPSEDSGASDDARPAEDAPERGWTVSGVSQQWRDPLTVQGQHSGKVSGFIKGAEGLRPGILGDIATTSQGKLPLHTPEDLRGGGASPPPPPRLAPAKVLYPAKGASLLEALRDQKPVNRRPTAARPRPRLLLFINYTPNRLSGGRRRATRRRRGSTWTPRCLR